MRPTKWVRVVASIGTSASSGRLIRSMSRRSGTMTSLPAVIIGVRKGTVARALRADVRGE